MQETMTDRNVSHPVVKGVSRKKVRTNEITTDDQNTPAKLDTLDYLINVWYGISILGGKLSPNK